MSRNIKNLLAVSVLFGLSFGIYDFVLPLFLDARGFSFGNMGLIFAISAAVMFVVRIYAGSLSDRAGRKVFYSLSLVGCTIAHLLTPILPIVAIQALLKSLRDASVVTRESMHSLLIWDEAESRFIDFIGKTRGFENMFQGGGMALAGLLIAWWSYGFSLYFAAGLLVIAAILFTTGYHEKPNHAAAAERLGFVEIFRFDLPPRLAYLTVMSFVFTIGLTTSHCFIMPLFFVKKFGASPTTVSWILAVHRILLGLPMIFVGRVVRTRFKAIWIVCLLYEGLAITGSSLIRSFWPATLLFLTHDLLGAGIWGPIQSHCLQAFARPETRGHDVSKALAFAALGAILGPILAGVLASAHISLPFTVSGILMVVAAVMLLAVPDITAGAAETPDRGTPAVATVAGKTA